MQFPMPIRNSLTGEERNFYDPQALSDFLASEPDLTVWEKRDAYGVLPDPTVVDKPEEVTEKATPVEPPDAPTQEPEPLL